MASLSPSPKLQFFDANGNPLAGGKVYTYAAGTTTPLATYIDSTGLSANTNPIILDSRGEANIWLTSASYKYVLKNSADVLIWTVDNIVSIKDDLANNTDATKGDALIGFRQSNSSGNLTGATGRTVHQKLQEMISVKDFGATGDGTTNDTTAIQNALTAAAGKSLYIPAGTYICDTLIVSSGTSVYGDSPSTTIIKAIASLSSSSALLKNLNQSGTPYVYTDSGISVQNIKFDGSNLVSRIPGIVDFGKVSDLTIENCHITNVQYIGISLSGCLYTNVNNCLFTNCGNLTVTPEGGPALWIGNSGDTTQSYDTKVSNNSFTDNNWSGIYATANRTLITNNYFSNNKESAIFNTGSVCVISNNWISYQTKKYISASGIEAGGDQLTITGNFIGNTESDCISLTDVQFATVTGNTLLNPRTDTTYYTQASCIMFYTLEASPNNTRYVNVVGNNMWSPTSIAYAAVNFYGITASPAEYITISDNQMNQNSWTSGQAIKVQNGQDSITQIFRDNPGAFDVFDYGGYASGRFYAGESLSPAASSTLAVTANTLYATPFVVRQQKLWTKIGVNVTTAVVGGSAYLGIYRMENGIPTSLVITIGAVGLDSTGTKELTMSQVLPAGMYCLALLANTSSAVFKAGTLSEAAVATIGTSAIGTADTVIKGSATYGVFPTTFPAVTYGTGDSALFTMRC